MTATLSDFLKGRIHQLDQPSPLIAFWEVAIPDGTYARYCNFFDDRSGASAPNKIPFNGSEFEAVDLSHKGIEESIDGSTGTFVLSVLDPLRSVTYFLQKHRGLVDQRVKLWLTTYDRITVPADADQYDFIVITAHSTGEPPTAHLVLGHYNLHESLFPKIYFDRERCLNDWHNRFIAQSPCNYPSTEFGPSYESNLLIGGSLEAKERRFGWFTQQALRANTFNISETTADHLHITSIDPICAWNGQRRYGPYYYRPISGDFDVHTHCVVLTGRDNFLCGILIQDMTAASPDVEEGEELPPSPTSSWLFWGIQDAGGGGYKLCSRKTDVDVSTDVVIPSVTDQHLRVKREGTTWSLYSAPNLGVAWTLRSQATLTLPTEVRVGVAVSSDAENSQQFGAKFDFVRFLSGGLTTCRQLWEDCQVRKMTRRFNGFREIANERARA